MSLCNKCPVKSTCGVYIGLRIVSNKNGDVLECNRYDCYTGEKTTKEEAQKPK